ncbi:MAG: hypothetical protein H0X29_09660 [Parachlamydiaceae bacterium]|nr:hypothetical protein [Parachlamydiaceae bacterium]
MELFFFLERLLGICYIHFEDGKLLINSLSEKNATFLPITDTEFLYVPMNESKDPEATLKLITPNIEGQFIQLSLGQRNAASLHVTLKRIPTWLAILEITIVGFVSLTFTSVLIYAPFWILRSLSKRHSYPAENSVRLWALKAVLSLLVIILICLASTDAFILRLGNMTVWSFSLFLATIVFALASVINVITLGRTQKRQIRGIIRIYSTMVAIALVIFTVYFAYWGFIGLRTWA